MTNLDRWNCLTETLESPDDYLLMSWYFAVSAALERRVWYGDVSRPMFVNQYILFVSDPNTGKGSAMREAFRLLRAFNAFNEDGTKRYCKDDPREREPLFYPLPDAVTFEKLVHAMADHTVPFRIPDTQDIYVHSSAYFGLEELASLIRRGKSEDVATFLQNLYDNEPYKYKTLHGKPANIHNGCLNLLAGTQVDFLRKVEKDGILSQGLTSRFLIVSVERKRKSVFDYPAFTPEQQEHKKYLETWLLRLSKVYGPIQYASDEDRLYLQKWHEEEDKYLEQFQDTKLANYFSRRKAHVMKLAAAIHFSESTDRVILRESFDKAIDLIHTFENGTIRVAHRAGRNLAFPIQERLITYLKKKPRTNAEVYRFLQSEMDLTEIVNTLTLLQQARRIEQRGEEWSLIREDNIDTQAIPNHSGNHKPAEITIEPEEQPDLHHSRRKTKPLEDDNIMYS